MQCSGVFDDIWQRQIVFSKEYSSSYLPRPSLVFPAVFSLCVVPDQFLLLPTLFYSPLSSLLSTNYLICKTRVVINVTVRHRRFSGHRKYRTGIYRFRIFYCIVLYCLRIKEKVCSDQELFLWCNVICWLPLLLSSVYFKFKVEKSAVSVQTYRVRFQIHILNLESERRNILKQISLPQNQIIFPFKCKTHFMALKILFNKCHCFIS